MGKLKLSDSELQFLSAVLRDSKDGSEFHLSEETRKALLQLFNLKLTPTQDKVICYQGHNLGRASEAKSSGRALVYFLKTHSFVISSEDLAEDLENFLTRTE